MTSCRGCITEWTTLTYVHCGGSTGCHATFSGATYFDWHRVNGDCWGISEAKENRHLTLVLEDGVWGTPEGHVERVARSDRMAKAREGK